jgi:hypothetical protein
MHTKQSRSGAFRRCLLVLPALIVGLSLVVPAAASAQTTVPFQASVNAINQKPMSCPQGICGSANIAGYGAATWTADVTSVTSVSSECLSYTATTTFTLASDGSKLVLDENGLGCGPGNSLNTPTPKAFGVPLDINGSWTVDTADSTGQFNGLTGNGTDTLSQNGARHNGTYSGTLLGP